MTLAVLQASVLQTNGALSVAAGAQITVRTPAGALATLYEDRAGTTPTGANPIFADSKGFFRVYVAPGRYDVTVTTSSGTQVYEDIALFADGSVIGTAAAATIGHATGNLIPAGGANGALTFGTNDAQPVATKTNNIERSRTTATGNHLIGTTTDNGVDKLQVNGSVRAQTYYSSPYKSQIRLAGALAEADVWESVYVFPNNGQLGGMTGNDILRRGSYIATISIGAGDRNRFYGTVIIENGTIVSIAGADISLWVRLVLNSGSTAYQLELKSNLLTYGLTYRVFMERTTVEPMTTPL